MRRRTILLSLLMALAPAARAQQEAPEGRSLSIEALSRDLSNVGKPELAERLEGVRAFSARNLQGYPTSPLPGATAGSLFRLDERGRLIAMRAPAQIPGEVRITEDGVREIEAAPSGRLAELLAAAAGRAGVSSPLTRLNDASKSVDPSATNWTLANLPPDWRPRAQAVAWNGAAGTFTPTCQTSRNTFSSVAEKALLGEDADPTAARPEPDRTSFINAINAFDRDCLSPIGPAALPLGGPPLRTVAVISGPRGAHCMATHLGGIRFLTARHCFYRSDGSHLDGYDHFAVSLIDGSAADVPVVEAAVQPLSGPPAASSARDMIVVEAQTLAPAVRQRPGPTLLPSSALSQVMISEAYVLGYFSLANPDQVIPAPGGPPGKLPAWNEALRTTTKVGLGYCRAWDYTPTAADGAACLQHSCQTVKGFSGAPVFVRQDSGAWVLAGVHVANGESAELTCGAFKSGQAGGLMRRKGGIAAALPNQLTFAAASPRSDLTLGK